MQKSRNFTKNREKKQQKKQQLSLHVEAIAAVIE
jgi:hypothetical protein